MATDVRLEDIDFEGIEQRHRDAMLKLILTWGTMDGALGMMLAKIAGKPLVDMAELISRANGSTRFAEMRKILKETPGAENAVAKLKKYKKQYEKFSTVRNAIAHSHCAGVLTKDREYLVFAAFEKV